MLSLLLLTSALAGAACPVSTTAIGHLADNGIVAFEAMDAAAFEDVVRQIRESVSCPDAAVDGVVAARLHLLMALDAYIRQDPERAQAGFRAVLASDPSFVPSSSLAPRGNELRDLWYAASKDEPGPTADLAKPTVGSFYVDGLPATARPSDRPFVLQWIDEEGRVRWSDYLPAGAHLPIEVLAAMHEEDRMDVFKQAPPPNPVDVPQPSVVDEGRGSGASATLFAGAGGAAVVSGGLLAAALVTRGKWNDAVQECVTWGGCDADPDGALQAQAELAQRARVLGYAAQGSAGLALGLGLVGGVTLAW